MAKPNKAKPKVKAHKAKAPKPKAKATKVHASKTLKPKAKVKKVEKSKNVKAPAEKATKTPTPKAVKAEPKANGASTRSRTDFQKPPAPKPELNLSPFMKKQRDRLLQLRDGMLDSMMGVAKDNLRSRAEGSEASAFGMHQADAGSDAYDRDFALSLLSQEQDALYEIDEALKRVEAGTYGVCEMSGKAIPHARLEAIPFARFTVECQSQLEKQNKMSRTRVPVTSLFGLTDDEGGDSEEEETPVESKD
ncbi:MAG: TraR/DksA C4-type zinc finger protein [Chthoniobacteraceae bacterium]